MPQMGVSVAEGTIASWLKQPGDEVAADETLCEVSTDKIDVEVPSPAAGIVGEHLVEEGETVPVGTVIARIDGLPGSAPGAERSETGTSPGAAGERGPGPGGGDELDRSRYYSPVVRRIADEMGIDLDRVEGHGVGRRIRKTDLLAHIARAEATVADNGGGEGEPTANGHDRPLHSESPYRPDADDEADGPLPAARVEPNPAADLVGPTRREPMEPIRKAIARHMVESRSTAAHCTTVVEADFSAVVRDRSERKGAMSERGVPLTYLAYVARAAIAGLQEHSILNASIEGDEIVHHSDVNLGIAVALADGLVVPVIRRAQRLSLEGLAAAIGDVANRARAGQLEPDDLVGGTFTITNPGQFGAVIATPIINQPQVGILDLEAVVRRPVAIEAADGSESIAIKPMSYLCMSWDHRALDGAVAARFLGGIKDRLEGADPHEGGAR